MEHQSMVVRAPFGDFQLMNVLKQEWEKPFSLMGKKLKQKKHGCITSSTFYIIIQIFVAIYHSFNNNNLDIRLFVSRNYS